MIAKSRFTSAINEQDYDFNTPTTPFKKHLEEIVSAIAVLTSKRQDREVILIKACACGLPLEDAVKLTIGDLLASAFQAKGSLFDQFCWHKMKISLPSIVSRYSRKISSRWKSTKRESTPAFPSSKTGTAITPATAVVVFKRVWRQHCSSDPLTLYVIKQVFDGCLSTIAQELALGHQNSNNPEGESARIISLLARIDWLFHKTINDQSLRDDLRQETVLRLHELEKLRGFPLDPQTEAPLARRVARCAFLQMQRHHELPPPCLGENDRFIADGDHIKVGNTVVDSDRKERLGTVLRGIFEELGPTEANVLKMRFGLGEEYSHSIAKIARLLGKSRPRINRILQSLMTRLSREKSLILIYDDGAFGERDDNEV